MRRSTSTVRLALTARAPSRLHRNTSALIVGVVVLLGVVAAFSPSVASARTAAHTDYTYCPTGLINTGTADDFANGSNCSFWLLRSFPGPQGGTIPGLDILPVWQTAQGAGVTVAVIDTGVDPQSADLAPNLLSGWNFVGNDANTGDVVWHGTAIASIIAAAANNGGYIGIAPAAKILPVKVVSDVAGPSDAIAQGVEYAIRHHAKVLNVSLGLLNSSLPGMDEALADAAKANVLVVFSAGNNGVNLDKPTNAWYPRAFGLPNTLSVADFSSSGTLASTSNFGARHVQIASLGSTLWVDLPGQPNGGSFGETSAAAATVSGLAADLFSAFPNATAAQVRRAIIVGANHTVPSLKGKVEANGLLSGTGAMGAMRNPDTTAPSAFSTPYALHFLLKEPETVTFGWTASSDPELEGYRLSVDGAISVLAPGTTHATRKLDWGSHNWTVNAYDYSGNVTVIKGGTRIDASTIYTAKAHVVSGSTAQRMPFRMTTDTSPDYNGVGVWLSNTLRVGMAIWPVNEDSYFDGQITFQWQRCDRNGAHCRSLTGPTAHWNSYTVTNADLGHTIVCVISGGKGEKDVLSVVSPVVLPALKR